MADVTTLQAGYQLGMRQDESRAFLPRGAVWNLVDYIPEFGAPLRKRGGWVYGSPDLTVTLTGSTYVACVAYAPFTGGAQRVAISDNSKLAKITSDTAATSMGTINVPITRPMMHNNLLIVPAGDGTTAPTYYDGTVTGTLGGSPPAGKYMCVSKDRTLLAGTAAKPAYVYFSQASDPAAAWDVTNSWLSVSQPVTGLAALPGSVLIFQQDRCARLRGSIPPSQGGALGSSDMILDDPIFNQGCLDARSIATFAGYAIFANASGLWLTNGSNLPENLTESVGLGEYWRTITNVADLNVSGGIYRGEYWCTVLNGTTLVDTLAIDLDQRRGRRVSNVLANSYAVTSGRVGDELFFSVRTAGRVGRLSTTFQPSAAYKSDGNGTAVTPLLETPFYRGRPGLKRWRFMYLDYDIRDAATDNPTLAVSFVPNPDDTYTAINNVLAETDTKNRSRLTLGFQSDGFGIKLQQANASSDTRLYEVGSDAHALETSRLPRSSGGGKAGSPSGYLVAS